MKQIDLREGARRQQRAISLFCVIQCWRRNLDGLAIERKSLERLLGLKRFKNTRIAWLTEDLKELFPYQQTYWSPSNSFLTLIISRSALKGYLPKGRMSTKRRLQGIPANGPRLDFFEIWEEPTKRQLREVYQGVAPFLSDIANYDERLLSSYLSLLVQGQISPGELPPPKAPKRGP